MSECYPMPVKERGFALVFVNSSFKDGTQQDYREGAELDLEYLKETFEELNFTVLQFENKTTTETLTALNKFASGKARSREHAAVVAFSTHGSHFPYETEGLPSDSLYCTDGTLRLSTVTDILAESKGLQGKPKMFFFQACRGEMYEETFEQQGASVERISMDLSGIRSGPITLENPLKKDMFMAFSCPPGYKALRSRSRGSFFVKALRDVIKEHGHDYDLLNLMIIVNNHSLDEEFMTTDGEPLEKNTKNSPWLASMLLKDVWFPTS